METSSTPRRYSWYYYMGFYHTHALALTTLSQAYTYLSPPELPECASLGSLQGSLACPPVPLSHVRRQSAWEGRKRWELPGHCSQAKAMAYCGIPHTELPTAGGQGGDGGKGARRERWISLDYCLHWVGVSFLFDRVVLTRTLRWQLQVMTFQRGILLCIHETLYKTYFNWCAAVLTLGTVWFECTYVCLLAT